MARLSAAFSFVAQLIDVGRTAGGDPRDGIDVLLALAGEEEGPAVILAALLMALGERAQLVYASGGAFVRVEIELEDLARLPPHADLLASRGHLYLPLAPQKVRTPIGLLPPPIREALRLRRPTVVRA